jgi:hypothetical protein
MGRKRRQIKQRVKMVKQGLKMEQSKIKPVRAIGKAQQKIAVGGEDFSTLGRETDKRKAFTGRD